MIGSSNTSLASKAKFCVSVPILLKLAIRPISFTIISSVVGLDTVFVILNTVLSPLPTVSIDLKAKKIEKALRKFLRKIVEIAIDEINKAENKAYKAEDVYFEFAHEIMSNAQENAQIKLTEAQTRQAEINTILSVANVLDDETVVKSICDWLDIDYEEIKDKLPAKEEDDTKKAQDLLKKVNVETGGEK